MLKDEDITIVPENSIVITREGVVFYAKDKKTIFSRAPSICFSLSEEESEEYNTDILLGLVVYFKSNFFLWYMLMFFESTNLLNLFLRKRKSWPIPIPKDKAILKTLSLYGKNIIRTENECLKHGSNCVISGFSKNKDKFSKIVNDNNVESEAQLHLAEKTILDYLNIDGEDAAHICKSLRELDYYTYNFEEFILDNFE